MHIKKSNGRYVKKKTEHDQINHERLTMNIHADGQRSPELTTPD